MVTQDPSTVQMVKQLLIWLLVKFKPDCRLTMGSNWSEVAVSTLLKRLPMISATPISTGRFLHRMARFDIFIFMLTIIGIVFLAGSPAGQPHLVHGGREQRWVPLQLRFLLCADARLRRRPGFRHHRIVMMACQQISTIWWKLVIDGNGRILSATNSHLTKQNRRTHLRSGPSFAGRLFYLAFYAGNLLGTAIT